MRLIYIATLLLIAALALGCSPAEEPATEAAPETAPANDVIAKEDFESGDTKLETSQGSEENEEEEEGEAED